MLKYLFFTYLFLEVIISVNIASEIGGLNTFFEIMISGVLGIALLINVKSTMMESIKALSEGSISMQQFTKLNIFAFLGALFLILPGFFSDIIGILMQFSVLTGLVMSRVMPNENIQNQNYQKGDDNVIDVEIVNDTITK